MKDSHAPSLSGGVSETPLTAISVEAKARKSGLQAPLVAIVVLNYDRPDLTLSCVESVLTIAYPHFRVFVVDNGSSDATFELLKGRLTDPQITLFRNDTNEGYAGGNNRGITLGLDYGADYIFILNNDALPEPGCVQSLVAAMQHDPRIGICGCPIMDAGREDRPNLGQRVNLYTGTVSLWPHAENPQKPVEVDYVCGAALMLSRRSAVQLGGFDPLFFLLWEDADICFRARKSGYTVCIVPGPGVRHQSSGTTGERTFRPQMTFYSIRNCAWHVRRHGRLPEQVSFGLLSFLFRYPRELLALLCKGDFASFGAAVRGIWRGHSVDRSGRDQSRSRWKTQSIRSRSSGGDHLNSNRPAPRSGAILATHRCREKSARSTVRNAPSH